MHFLGQHKFVLSFLALLVFCSAMVVWQLDARKSKEQSKHVELREAMILLQTGGYTNQADKLYLRLLRDLDRLSNKTLIEDWQRTVILVDPGAHQPSNAVWRYYWTVRLEMERRAEDTIQRALKLADEEK
jgi:plasmid replication initiation protein